MSPWQTVIALLVFTTHLVEAEIALDDDRYHLSPSCVSIIPTGFSTASLLEEDKNGLFFTFSAEINGFPFYRIIKWMQYGRYYYSLIFIYLYSLFVQNISMLIKTSVHYYEFYLVVCY